MDLNSRVILSENIFVQDVDGEMVLMDMESEEYFGLDTIGATFWQALQETERLQETLKYLLEMYEVEESVLEKDLVAFVEKLRANGLAVVDQEAS